MASTEIPIRQRVAAGAEWLDEHAPGWHRDINTRRLAMGSPDECILGQLATILTGQPAANFWSIVDVGGNPQNLTPNDPKYRGHFTDVCLERLHLATRLTGIEATTLGFDVDEFIDDNEEGDEESYGNLEAMWTLAINERKFPR